MVILYRLRFRLILKKLVVGCNLESNYSIYSFPEITSLSLFPLHTHKDVNFFPFLCVKLRGSYSIGGLVAIMALRSKVNASPWCRELQCLQPLTSPE